jgi:hypothetical protein
MEKHPLLSIVVPTKNRYETLIPLVSSIKKWKADNFELIIQDNSDTQSDSLVNFIANDKRINYVHISKSLSAIENCDSAVKRAVGRYVCFLGDDDGIVESIMQIIPTLEEHNIESVSFKRGVYFWPKFQMNLYGEKFGATLFLPRFSGKYEKIDVLKELNMVLNIGSQEFRRLPRLYHGLVRRDVLERVLKTTGSFFPGSVPDMSNSIALSSIITNHIVIDTPFTITGSSPKSMSAKGAKKEHHGSIQGEKTLPADALQNWNEKIPKYWSAPTIWADSAHSSLRRMQHTELLNSFNYTYMYKFCDMHLPNQYKTETNRCRKLYSDKSSVREVIYGIQMIKNRGVSLLRNVLLLFFPKFNFWGSLHQNMQNIEDVNMLTDKLICRTHITMLRGFFNS